LQLLRIAKRYGIPVVYEPVGKRRNPCGCTRISIFLSRVEGRHAIMAAADETAHPEWVRFGASQCPADRLVDEELGSAQIVDDDRSTRSVSVRCGSSTAAGIVSGTLKPDDRQPGPHARSGLPGCI
jgi:hypothetical protein